MRSAILLVFLSLLAACTNTNTAADQRHAKIHLTDGTDVAGTVTASSATEVTVAQPDGSARVIPMKQVRAIEYSDPGSAAESATSEDWHEKHRHPEQSAIQTKTYILPVGTEMHVRTEETIDSATAVAGQTYAAEIEKNVTDADGAVVIPSGSNAKIVMKSASKGGHIRGASDLILDLDSVSVGGRAYHLVTNDIEKRGRDGVGANRRTAEFSGGGAAIGAIIGAIAGGGKGAAIGAGSGAGAGAVTQIATKGGSVRVPAETVLTFKLDRELRVTEQQ